MPQDNKSNIALIVSVVISLVVGTSAGYFIGGAGSEESSPASNNTQTVTSPTQAVDSSAAGVRVQLNNALREHVSLGAAALRAAFDGDPNTEALLGTLDENSKEVAGLVGAVYGDTAGEQFLALWRNHIGFFADYTSAAKAGNQNGMQKALDDLAGYSTDAAAFFSSANPNLPADAVKMLLTHHRDHVIDAVNAWGAGDFALSYEKEQEARDQVGLIGDALASAIVKQSPEKFND